MNEMANVIKMYQDTCDCLSKTIIIKDKIIKELQNKINLTTPPQPTIIKSGDTWVAEYDGVDYLLLSPKKFHGVAKDIEGSIFIKQAFPNDKHSVSYWKPISEIEITDEIALLRPIITMADTPAKLYGVIKDDTFSYIGIRIGSTRSEIFNIDYRLATVKDLSQCN